MMSDDEARSAYGEILQHLSESGASALVDSISDAVAEGRVHERRRRRPTLEPLSPRRSLALAIRMLAAWLEPSLLVAEARKEFGHPSGVEPDVRWADDRVDVVVEEYGGLEPQPSQAHEDVVEIPALTDETAEVLRAHLGCLHEFTIELAAEEDSREWRR